MGDPRYSSLKEFIKKKIKILPSNSYGKQCKRQSQNLSQSEYANHLEERQASVIDILSNYEHKGNGVHIVQFYKEKEQNWLITANHLIRTPLEAEKLEYYAEFVSTKHEDNVSFPPCLKCSHKIKLTIDSKQGFWTKISNGMLSPSYRWAMTVNILFVQIFQSQQRLVSLMHLKCGYLMIRVTKKE